MKEKNINTEEIPGRSPELDKVVETDSVLKEWLVGHVGELHQPKDGAVTVEMIIDIVADEFPEFLMAVAEENWIRGYHQALTDVEEGEKEYREQLRKQNENETLTST